MSEEIENEREADMDDGRITSQTGEASADDPGVLLKANAADGTPEDAAPEVATPEDAAPDIPAEDRPRSGFGLLRYALPSFAAIGALELFRQRFERNHMFEPTRYPVGDWQPVASGLDVADVYFESEDGTPLHGWWIEGPRRIHADAPMTVVYCHGNKGSIAERVEIFRQLRRLDIDIFAYDYRGFGRSAGTPSEDGVCMDARAAIDYVHEQLEVPFERMILFGHSLGGAIAIDAALHRPQIAGLVVQSSFTQTVDMARHFYPDLPLHLITTNRFRSIEKVRLLPMPKLFIHGAADKKVPFQHGEALFAAAAEPKSWMPIARADHSDVHQWGGLRYFSRLVRFRREARRYGLERAEARGE